MLRIDNDWLFTENYEKGFDKAKTVRLPHTVKELPLHYIDSNDYQMISGYRKMLQIDEDMRGKRLFLQFDGCAHIATVYVNGKEKLTHKSGYTAFRVEITDDVVYGEENTIDVKLDSTENASIPPFGFVIDYLTFGGIYRDVWLDVRSSSYIDDFYVKTPDVTTCDIDFHIDGNAKNMSVLVEILNSEGQSVMKGSCDASVGQTKFTVSKAQPWSLEHPNLYTARLTLLANGDVLDISEKKFGFRTVEWNENRFLLNGERVFIRGLNRHQCYPYVGYAASESLQREDARILDEELHVNAVRTSHYPQSHYFLDECDKRGILVFTEIPGWQHIGSDPEWKAQCIQNVREMVLEYRQHPSIFLWGVRVNESQDDDELYAETNKVAHELDPMRKTSGVRYLEKSSFLEDIYSYNDFSHDGTTPGAKKKNDVTPDTSKPLLISEANGHMFPTKSYDPQSKRQEHALRHARVLNAAMEDGGHAGCYQWCMFDYPTHQDFGSGDRICYHGVMDMFRNPKLAASVYAMQSDEEPVLEIGTSMDIGDYSGGQIGKIYAFTNADEVKLYKNDDYVASFSSSEMKGLIHGPVEVNDTIGNLLKTKEGMDDKEADLIRECLLAARDYGMANLPTSYKLKLAYAMMKYKLKFEDGYRLYGTYVGNWGGEATTWRFDAIKNNEVVKSVTKKPNAQLHLEVKVSGSELTEGDTYDMCGVRIRILDANSNVASYSQIPVSLTVDGAVELVGDGVVTAEGGMTGCYVRTIGSTGEGTLTVHTSVTEDVTVKFTVKEG